MTQSRFKHAMICAPQPDASTERALRRSIRKRTYLPEPREAAKLSILVIWGCLHPVRQKWSENPDQFSKTQTQTITIGQCSASLCLSPCVYTYILADVDMYT